jgi:S1-C subfamily serine protease
MDAGSGALVAEVASGSAAEKAGLKPGDVVVSIAGHPVKNARDFYNSEGQLALGQSLRVDYVREGKPGNVTLVIKPIPRLKGEDLDARLKGARFSELGANLKQEDYSGVLLDQLDPKSRLAYQGLAKGDIITGVNRKRIRNLNDFKASLENLRGTIYLQIVRGQRTYVARIE